MLRAEVMTIPQLVEKITDEGGIGTRRIPWGHHVLLMKKLKEPAARLYYLRATAQCGWSRSVLLNQIKGQP